LARFLINNPEIKNLLQTTFAAVDYPIAFITADLKGCVSNNSWQSLLNNTKEIYSLFKLNSILEAWPKYKDDSFPPSLDQSEVQETVTLSDMKKLDFRLLYQPLYWENQLQGIIVAAKPENLNDIKRVEATKPTEIEDSLRTQFKALETKNVSLMAFIEPLTRTISTLLSNNSDEASSSFKSHLNMTHLRNFIENVPVACAMFDKQMNYLMLSKAWHAFTIEKANLKNYPQPESMIGKNHYEVSHITPQNLKDVHSRCLKGEAERSEGDWYRDAEGRIRWHRWECFPWYQDKGEIGGIIIFLEDITEKKNTEKHLERMKHTNALLEYFADICSHDLKQPVRTIGNFTQILIDEYGHTLEKKAKSYLNEIQAGAKRLYELIDSILVYTKIDIDTHSLKPIALDEVIKTVVADLDALIQEKKGTIKVKHLPTILSHKAILYHVFQNLLSNALNFSSSKAPLIEIEAKLANEYWQFLIKDNGIGIPIEFHHNIFDMHWRYEKGKNLAGSGIGLAVCKRIIEALGGDIWVESSSAAGTIFMFTLPANEKQI
jgi:two-component system sensor kinase FixL